MPILCSVQTVLLSCTNTNTISKLTKMRFHTTHVTYKFHRVRPKLFMTYGTFSANPAPIMCGTISKWTEQSSTRPSSPEVPWVRLKRFMSLWYVWSKLSTYLALTLTLSQNISKRDSTWPTSPRSFIDCVQYYFWAYGTFNANHALILHQE
jgi:hypothetical protein